MTHWLKILFLTLAALASAILVILVSTAVADQWAQLHISGLQFL